MDLPFVFLLFLPTAKGVDLVVAHDGNGKFSVFFLQLLFKYFSICTQLAMKCNGYFAL